jgi:hypothetical protein
MVSSRCIVYRALGLDELTTLFILFENSHFNRGMFWLVAIPHPTGLAFATRVYRLQVRVINTKDFWFYRKHLVKPRKPFFPETVIRHAPQTENAQSPSPLNLALPMMASLPQF